MNKRAFVQKKHNLLESNFEDCAMLYDVEVGRYYVLNNVGSLVWGQINEKVGIAIETIIGNMQALYPSIETIEQDVILFNEEAVEKGIILLGE